jgi:hypothetical protein
LRAGWPKELLDMMYLDEDLLAWAQATEKVRTKIKLYIETVMVLF